eukprot:Anaeramoba_ignava/a624450_49.p1 GENE.a624450_49~~a624450_49.p1  ORF type:complete len:173 (+),score=58.08 a624450_49:3-521(+)
MTEDIKAAQKKVEWADLIIFQFPLWWFGIPAILKGWLDRVLTSGWAYSYPNIYDKGPFVQKKVLISTTTGGPEFLYSKQGLNGDLSQIFFPFLHSFYFCGFQVLEPEFFWSPTENKEKRKLYLKRWIKRLKQIDKEEVIPFSKMGEYTELTSLKKPDIDFMKRPKKTDEKKK